MCGRAIEASGFARTARRGLSRMIRAGWRTGRDGVWGVCVAALVLSGCASNSLQKTSTADAGDLVGSPLALVGLRGSGDDEEIEYGPRSPLVMPPETELRPPEERVADRGPDWPDDPDVRARRVRSEMRRAAREETVRDVEFASAPMTRRELDEWGERYGRVDDSPYVHSRRRPNEALTPEELAARSSDDDEAEMRAEPPRRRLTDPPAGFRRPAETAEMPESTDTGFFGRILGTGGTPGESRARQHDPTRDF